jgi:hypothetical protein
MPTSLSKEYRKLLEKTTADARILAESACRAALENLAVHEKEYRTHMNVEQRMLRNRLRARGRALGDNRDERSGVQEIHHLNELAAYEHWHRLLFTRFLTENNLLMTDEANGAVPVTLEECEELAPELGAHDGLDLACRFANLMLPGVFRRDDPVLDLPIAINDQVELRKLLAILPSQVFRADDSLGWTYQFWQAQRKDEVNASGKKIGAEELAPVTQLFTEDYMVEFLLHNTLGAWWSGKIGHIKAESEEEARAQAALPARDGVPAISWTYLRFVLNETTKIWLPAAGTFDGWPKLARLIRLLDPCMGSGHFLVFALPLLVRLRMEEEKLSVQTAVVAVLKDNIHGLELDERCTQIAAFNVALTAWKLAGYQTLPPLNLACSGLAPSATKEEWMALAGDNDRLQRGMARLHSLFKDAPVLGSLINPRAFAGDMIEADFHELAPLLSTALEQSENKKNKLENDAAELAVIAQGLTKAAELLAGQFTLVTTNVPYLGRLKQDDVLREFCGKVYPQAKADLATCFIERSLDLCSSGGASTLVVPQIWLFLKTYKELRISLLKKSTWNFVAKLGTKAFETIGGEVVNVNLQAITRDMPSNESRIFGLDVGNEPSATAKADQLSSKMFSLVPQIGQLKNPNSTIVFEESSGLSMLSEYADSIQGASTLDIEMFRFYFWEPIIGDEWVLHQSTPTGGCLYSGLEYVSIKRNRGGRFEKLAKELKAENRLGGAWSGQPVWGKIGISCGWMGSLPTAIYLGAVYDNSIAAIIPKDPRDLTAIWSFCSSDLYEKEVRKVNQKSQVANATLVQVPFELARWQCVAAEKYPNGLPKPHSADPTQWLFNGHPKASEQPLHVAVARLLGYRWPRQTGSSFPDCPAISPDELEPFADENGIVCLPPLNHEQPAAARLRKLLTAAIGTFDERALVSAAGLEGSYSKTLEDWLRDEFFEQHCIIFHDRPFIWHLWDGRHDGFHALANYHKLDYPMLQKLTYSYLGDWIQQQSDDAKSDKPGAATRLGAARILQTKLAAILEGEDPLDIFARWKPIKDQAQGWHPDLNDGIRQNIRPFLLAGDVGKRGAGLFRTVPLDLKDKDRGIEPIRSKSDYPWFWCEEAPCSDPVGGEEFIGSRWNNVHLTLAQKQKAQ